MIRTDVVNLTTIEAVAYRQKLNAGGSGIVILRADFAQPGIASISKTSGEAIPSANTPKDKYPKKAFQEAIALTAGMPYQKRGNVNLKSAAAPQDKAEEPEVIEEPEAIEEEVVVDSAEYQKIVEKYTDKNGKLSYDLLNKDMIQFAHSSSTAREMIAEGKPIEEIRLYVVGKKFRSIAHNPNMTDAEVLKIVELLDEVSPKGVFKDFNADLRNSLNAQKKKK